MQYANKSTLKQTCGANMASGKLKTTNQWLTSLWLEQSFIFTLFCFLISYLSGVKAKDFQVSDSAVSPLLIEMNHLRNHSGIVKERLEAQAKLVKERANHVQLKLQVKQMKVENDLLQRQIETLNAAKSNLQTNKTLLGKFNVQPVFVNMQHAVNLHSLL